MTSFPIDRTKILDALKYPDGIVDVVIDTDTYNEVDDQFALAYLLRNSRRLRLQKQVRRSSMVMARLSAFM